ncbi:hypothetical protein A2721_02855 [Candidatus Gottesmanbacteria bacterium RIFCSPHIGHO2_01_FULL_47_48]|uniref:Membrane protease subunit n=1 Tax=Candidatus Gottesmanbacteria bacterium RIFCSPHIGHO2_01_FULL_47_48 TaxID=1798381 RepID=A0A1F6A3Y9_9BACT|nr:MAG: hypothetical protein A2721_02855 [Candidatus Gottesmanbacteria bacterium RIFCSPHIGHO2_01_FULL_47_48]
MKGVKRVKLDSNFITFSLVGVVVLVSGMGFLLWLFPTYNIWASEQNGRAELAQAEWSKRVAVESARAKKDSAALEAQAEVEKAKGVAASNQIIGDGLRGKEEYLRYLYITNLEEGQNREVIYIPTEAGLPILEAQRLGTVGR